MKIMRKYVKNSGILYLILFSLVLFPACEDFLDPQQELAITEDQLYSDWYEYRAVEMGMYGFQQELVEQLMVLGELRGDLLTVTENADADLVEINNFNISESNKYASPTNFFKLINAANNFIRILEKNHPEVMDPESPISNYDRLYGEALCMRAWAYFNAVRIYGKVPFIHESLVTMEEILDYVNSPGTYIDSVHIEYDVNGFDNDTTYNKPIELEKKLYDTEMVIDYFTNQLENKVKAVGVNHAIDIDDPTWEVTIWNTWAMHALLGHMYLTIGDYANARIHFDEIVRMRDTEEPRYLLDFTFFGPSWQNIFQSVDIQEHIYTIQFSKEYFQQNDFQRLFEAEGPHDHMLQPTRIATDMWETVYNRQQIDHSNADPGRHKMDFRGSPTDNYRGYGASYWYYKNGQYLGDDYADMILKRYYGDLPSSREIMIGVDTIVAKYSIGRQIYSEDANYIIYRAGGIHLYIAELYTYWGPEVIMAQRYLNDGAQYNRSANREQLGVRGRAGVGLVEGVNGLIIFEDDQIEVSDIIYEHDPYTNEITGYKNFRGNLYAKQKWFEEQILDERARELAFEGERFYDLMRVAKRRGEPEFLAEKVAAKFSGEKRDQIYNYLLDENNWYINYFE
ncbi:MAG: RagB/SusD family nutrient uptake outer membrane protein [Bacteroidota bacterium]